MACRSLFGYCHELLSCLEAGGSLVSNSSNYVWYKIIFVIFAIILRLSCRYSIKYFPPQGTQNRFLLKKERKDKDSQTFISNSLIP